MKMNAVAACACPVTHRLSRIRTVYSLCVLSRSGSAAALYPGTEYNAVPGGCPTRRRRSAAGHSPQPAAHQYGQPLAHSSVELEPTKNCACGLGGLASGEVGTSSSRPLSWRTPPAHHARTHPQHSSRASSRTHPAPRRQRSPTSSCRHQCSPILRFFPFSSSTVPSNTAGHGSLRVDAIRQLPVDDVRPPPTSPSQRWTRPAVQHEGLPPPCSPGFPLPSPWSLTSTGRRSIGPRIPDFTTSSRPRRRISRTALPIAPRSRRRGYSVRPCPVPTCPFPPSPAPRRPRPAA